MAEPSEHYGKRPTVPGGLSTCAASADAANRFACTVEAPAALVTAAFQARDQ